MTDVIHGNFNRISNSRVAELLHEVADLLEAQAANPFRIAAYRTAAETVRQTDEPVADILHADGKPGLMELHGIGRSIANSISQIVSTDRLPLLERLRGDYEAERVFATVPDIGPGLAKRIHDHLGIESLPELHAAAIDGRLADVPGMGTKRIRAVRESLAGRFQLGAPRVEGPYAAEESDVPLSELLDLDETYRRMAAEDKLPRIAPRRFNPTQSAWLPILHAHRGDRHYTALFSNTARAHEMGATHDWVVIYRDDEEDHGRWTVITSQFGKLKGYRIVRGRESECLKYYGLE